MLVEGDGDLGFYVETLIDYVHLNPVRAGIFSVQNGGSVCEYPWSSVAWGYAVLPSKRPKWQYCEEVFAAFGWKDNASGRRNMIEHLDARAAREERERCGVPDLPSERDRRFSKLRKGWYWGSQAFCERLLALVGQGLAKTAARGYKSSPEVKEHGERAAEQLIEKALSSMKAEERIIEKWTRGDPRKVALAAILRKRTTVSNQWIADRLRMASSANVSQRVRTADLRRLARAIPPVLAGMLREVI